MGNKAANLPDAIIGGAPRSGTTFLCHELDKHPEIYVAKPFIPEPKVCMTPCDQGIDGYRKRYAQLFSHAGPEETVRIEKCSYYLENDEALGVLGRVLGVGAKYLFIVREPVERAFSNYLWTRQNGLEDLSFEEAVEREGARENPLGPERAYARPFDYLTRGDYGAFAERYYTAFGRRNVKFVLYENIALNPEWFFKDILEFLGVEPQPAGFFETEKINDIKDHSMAMDPAFLSRLRDRMKPCVQRFASITGLDVSVWGYEI